MKLVLVRHAAAIVSKENRYLTIEGREFFRRTAMTMLKSGIDPSLILASPQLRAVQTADILAETLSYSGPLVVRDELKSDFDMTALRRLLDDYQGIDELVLVGHEPDMSGLAAALLSIAEKFEFEKGAALLLKIDSNDLNAPATFKWLAVGKKLIKSRKEAFASERKHS